MKALTLAELVTDVSVVQRAKIMEVLATGPSELRFDMHTPFLKAAAAVEADDPELSIFYRILALAFDAVLRPANAREPFGAKVVWKDGSESFVPTSFRPGQLQLLQAVINDQLPPFFNARLADILWVCKFGGGKEARGYAEIAIRAYIADARVKQTTPEWPQASFALERALRLTYLLGRSRGEDAIKEVTAAAEDFAVSFEQAHQWVGASKALHLLSEFGIGDRAAIAEACERCADAAEADPPGLLAEQLWEQAVGLWRGAAQEDRYEGAIRRATAIYLRQSAAREADSAGVAAHFLTAAIKSLRRLPASKRANEEAELARKLAELQAASLKEMKTIGTTFDGREIWERAEAAVTGKSLLDALVAFVLTNRPQSVAEVRRRVEGHVEQFPMLHLFPPVLTGDGGKTIKHVPSIASEKEADRETAMRFHMIRDANWNQDLIGKTFVEAARWVIASEHGVSEADLLPAMHQSIFVPTGREWQWAKAFAFAFDRDFTAATHILIPQLEHALRVMLRAHGEPAVTMDSYGQQEDWNLNHILLHQGRAQIETILGVDAVFDLTALLSDRGGANLRNAVSHGLVDDGGLETGYTRYLFWICMRLCFLPLIAASVAARRAEAQATGAENNLDSGGNLPPAGTDSDRDDGPHEPTADAR